MRTVFLSLVLAAAVLTVRAGETGRVFLPDLLPSNTILCVVPPDNSTLEKAYTGSIFQRVKDMPEMAPFLRTFEESRRSFAGDIAQSAGIPPQLALDITEASHGLAVINVGLGRDGAPTAEFVVALSLKQVPDRDTVFAAVMALLNRPEVVRAVLESQGMDPNLPLRSLAQEETLSGYPPILRIGPNIRVAALGSLVLFYHGPGSDGIKKLFDAAANPASSLSRNPSFAAAYRGAEASQATSFGYVNVPRLMSILDVLGLGQLNRIADAAGFGSVQSVGAAGAYTADGVRHSMYVHIPDGSFTGLMASVIPMPADSPVGMEGFGTIIPSAAEAFMSFRVDIPTFLRELPYFLDAMGSLVRPGGMQDFISNESILGVPVAELAGALGGDVVIRPHDDTQVVMFHSVNIQAFENAVARMEQNAGTRFNAVSVGGYTVRYYNRRASVRAPLAPAFCLIPHQAGGSQGILYMASHPQAVVSLIQELAAAREPVSGTPDFGKTSAGMNSNYSMYYYNGNREAYRHVYNFLLPIAALWSSSSKYPADTGLLPTATAMMPAFFGSAYGVKRLPDGLQVHAYSPIGASSLLVILADKLVVNNPLLLGYTYAMIEDWMEMLPGW